MQEIKYSDMMVAIYGCDEKGNPIPFSIVGYHANRGTREAGEIYEYHQVVISSNVKHAPRQLKGKKPKNPKHAHNKTINVVFANGDIRKVHTRLIVEFNRMKVIW